MLNLTRDASVHFVTPDTKRAALNGADVFLHAPADRAAKNMCALGPIELEGLCLFRSGLWLPSGAAPVRFGVTVRSDAEVVVGEWSFDHSGANERRWGANFEVPSGRYLVDLWTMMAPEALGNVRAWAKFIAPTIWSEPEWFLQTNARGLGRSETELSYDEPDPWGYERNSDDAMRRARLLSAIPRRSYERTLDIGCGDGFITFSLPGAQVTGCDFSDKAIARAIEKQAQRADGERFAFISADALNLRTRLTGVYDLVVVTGVLYPHYIGTSWSVVDETLRSFMRPQGILVACHIHDWTPHRFKATRVRQSFYRYRDYTHCLEVFTA